MKNEMAHARLVFLYISVRGYLAVMTKVKCMKYKRKINSFDLFMYFYLLFIAFHGLLSNAMLAIPCDFRSGQVTRVFLEV